MTNGRLNGQLDGDDGWQVRPVPGAAAHKAYRCPGCDQEILPGQPHLVAWPTGDPEQRRHWHRVCWEARDRRAPRLRRPRRR
ncbi:MAG TPA: hypothetical protein VLR26_14370 [Frankiaceae bacterium]|nr:hypothetical protein [Frankiaceae bacterium]